MVNFYFSIIVVVYVRVKLVLITDDILFDFCFVFFSLSLFPLVPYNPCHDQQLPPSFGLFMCRLSCWCVDAAGYSPCCIDHAVENETFEQVFRERLKVLHSKITARNERIKLLMQRGSPDLEPLDPVT